MEDVPAEDRQVRALMLDRLVHSYSDITDGTYLAYGYERTHTGLVRALAARKADFDVLFIGGGAYTFPRCIAW